LPLAIETRMKKYCIKRDRAEVIGFAAGIFIDAADAMQINEIIVPSINITDGIINKMFFKYLKKNGYQIECVNIKCARENVELIKRFLPKT
jgi:exopolyphosphatase/pppGpp-phosphohydrolase